MSTIAYLHYRVRLSTFPGVLGKRSPSAFLFTRHYDFALMGYGLDHRASR